MKKIFHTCLMAGALACGIVSCGEDKAKQWTKGDLATILDSLGRKNIIASYVADNCISVLVFDGENNRAARKLSYRKNFPVSTDSLVYKKHDEFSCPKLNTVYLIKDTAVIVITYVKIIHPSSNWQGQTPWQQPYVFTYARTDVR